LDHPAVQSAPVSATPGGGAPTNLAGKWTLAAPGAGSCVMNFGAQPDAIEGTIAPAGGCPYNFFTSRKWSYTVSGAPPPPCGVRADRQDASPHMQFGSHIWLTI
jgi:hypothetical protein